MKTFLYGIVILILIILLLLLSKINSIVEFIEYKHAVKLDDKHKTVNQC